MPFALFFVAVGGIALAAAYYLYTTFFGARVAARCVIPGDVFVDLSPHDNPVRIELRTPSAPQDRPHRLRVELEREGSWLWSREITVAAATGPARGIAVDDFAVDRPGRYRVRGSVSGAARGARPGRVTLQVAVRVHRVRPAVYLLATGLLVGGVGGLAVLLAR